MVVVVVYAIQTCRNANACASIEITIPLTSVERERERENIDNAVEMQGIGLTMSTLLAFPWVDFVDKVNTYIQKKNGRR